MALKLESKILVIDDMSIMRRMIKKMFVEMGYNNLLESDDGINAWPLIEAAQKEGSPFDFIVSDWNMPEMSGIDLLIKIRSTPGLEKLPFLMITAETDAENLVAAEKAGVSGFIKKPFTIDHLKEKMGEMFK
ncbi:MAG: response regulator [Bacteriovorax sp.]|nr:response regulator [Bacteriovorax sp.]